MMPAYGHVKSYVSHMTATDALLQANSSCCYSFKLDLGAHQAMLQRPAAVNKRSLGMMLVTVHDLQTLLDNTMSLEDLLRGQHLTFAVIIMALSQATCAC